MQIPVSLIVWCRISEMSGFLVSLFFNVCLELNWFVYNQSWMLHLSEFVWTLRSSVLVVFNNFLLRDATDRSKISSDQKRFFNALSLYPLSFFANTRFNPNLSRRHHPWSTQCWEGEGWSWLTWVSSTSPPPPGAWERPSCCSLRQACTWRTGMVKLGDYIVFLKTIGK